MKRLTSWMVRLAASRLSRLGLLLAGLLVAAGCASPTMKGSPFYTGEYSAPRGPVEDRVALWPFVYYRDPVLSVLWPLIERTDDHVAVRPVFSVYGLDHNAPVYNVLWPLGRFDPQNGDNRIFPVSWGEESCSVFPLYWHRGSPFSGGTGHDTLFPLWSYSRNADGYSLHVLPPIINRKETSTERGWRVWPLVGSYADDSRRTRFYLWPLGHQWESDSGRAGGHSLLPLYWYEYEETRSSFLSLPYSAGSSADGSNWKLALPLFFRSSEAGGARRFLSLPYSCGRDPGRQTAWSLLCPLYYTRESGDSRLVATLLGGYQKRQAELAWLALPLLAGGHTGPGASTGWAGGLLAHWWRDDEHNGSYVFPFYYRSHSDNAERWYSLPWSFSRTRDGDGWELAPPFYCRVHSSDSACLLTPLYSSGHRAAGRETWQCLFPLYYARQSPASRLVATLAGGYETDEEGHRWRLYPLLSGGHVATNAGSFWLMAPLVHARWDEAGSAHHVLPLYYWNGWDRTLVSPLIARWQSGDHTTTLVPPLLSALTRTARGGDCWAAAGLAHFAWGDEAGSSHVLPLYFLDRRKDLLLTLALASWRRADGRRTTALPLVASWHTWDERRHDAWLLGPLAHFSWGPEADTSHVLPLFYHNRRTGTCLSPVWAEWSQGVADCTAVPPLLSWWSRSADGVDVWAALGLAHVRTSSVPERREGHLLPLYYYEGDRAFYTLLFGWDRDLHEGFTYFLTPLVAVRRGECRGGWVFPLFSRRQDQRSGVTSGTILWGTYRVDGGRAESGLFPVYRYVNNGPVSMATNGVAQPGVYGRDFRSLFVARSAKTVTVEPDREARRAGSKQAVLRTDCRLQRLFPVWRRERVAVSPRGTVDEDAALLLALYDFHHEVRPASGTELSYDYARTRVLWRVWHSERLNGTVSTDVFPFITYDSRPDGFRKTTFLWRFFRYETGQAGTKVDLCFLPVYRSKGVSQP